MKETKHTPVARPGKPLRFYGSCTCGHIWNLEGPSSLGKVCHLCG